MHFQGDWETPFSAERTAPRAFHVAQGDPIEVPFLNGQQNQAYAFLDEVHVLQLPFQMDRFALHVIVPDAVNGIADVEAKLTAGRWTRWQTALTPHQVTLSIPKLELRHAADLNGVVSSLGGSSLFGSSADLSGFAGAPGELFVDGVIQEAVIKLDEKGVEAAAATAIRMRSLGIETPPKNSATVIADRPFLMVLTEQQTGTILFMARVLDPRP